MSPSGGRRCGEATTWWKDVELGRCLAQRKCATCRTETTHAWLRDGDERRDYAEREHVDAAPNAAESPAGPDAVALALHLAVHGVRVVDVERDALILRTLRNSRSVLAVYVTDYDAQVWMDPDVEDDERLLALGAGLDALADPAGWQWEEHPPVRRNDCTAWLLRIGVDGTPQRSVDYVRMALEGGTD